MNARSGLPGQHISEIPKQDEEGEVVDSGSCYGMERGYGRAATMLDLRFKDGKRFMFFYHGISPAEFDKDITMTATMPNGDEYKITISGRNLLPLYDAIRRNRCTWIKEMDQLRDTSQESATVVHAVNVTKVVQPQT
jgi:hypothetical protein